MNETVPQCEVELGMGFTEPTKPFGNVKVFVGLKVQCAVGEQDDVYAFCDDWVGERLTEKMNEIKEQYPD